MERPGPPPNPLARRKGKKVLISLKHIGICDSLKTGNQSRADVIEIALENLERLLDDIGPLG